MTLHLLNACKDVQLQYINKRQKLDLWKNCFQQLDQDIVQLSTLFEQHYENSVISDEFSVDVKEKLENRREGIRLSVKSASRLQRKLNLDKPVEPERIEVVLETSDEEAIKDIENQLQSLSFTESQEEVEANQPREAEEATEIVEEEVEVISETEEDVDSESTTTVFLQELSQKYEDAIELLDAHIEGAEKRFLTFIEKSIAPILDGLYSGETYGKDLLEELHQAEVGQEELLKVSEWLSVYRTFMQEIETLFTKFSIGLYVPAVGDVFDEYKHDPIGVVEDANFEDEQIKEVVRFGLFYTEEIFNQTNFLIRPAQVIVIKNKTQHAIDVQGE